MSPYINRDTVISVLVSTPFLTARIIHAKADGCQLRPESDTGYSEDSVLQKFCIGPEQQ